MQGLNAGGTPRTERIVETRNNIGYFTLIDGGRIMPTFAPTTNATFLLILALLITTPVKGSGDDLQSAIDPLAKQLLADKLTVGFVVGIYKDGKKQVIGYGETEQGKGIAPDANTIYEIGSISKVFTGVLLADMVERGRVQLDDPMQTYLSEPTKTELKNPTHITFENLATHTSGLPRLPDNLKMTDPMNPYADYTFGLMFAFLKEYPFPRSPGEYEYSNFGMGLLGVLLASREKESYEELLVERIAKPCGMDDTRVNLSDKQRQRLAPPYDAALQAAKNWDIPTLAGAGGIHSTANDMLKFIEANLATDDKLLTKACQLSQKKRHDIPGGQAIGLAWHIARDGITRWQNGGTGGYSAWVGVIPSRNLGVVVLSNTAGKQIDGLGENIIRIAFGGKIEPPKAPTIVKVPKEVLKSYEGSYAIAPQFVLTVTVEGDKLMVQATGQPKFEVYPEFQTKFFYKVVDAQLYFVPEKNGKADLLILHQNGTYQVAARK